MNQKNDALAEKLKGLSNEELKGMLQTGLKEYTEEALAAARAELERRGTAGGIKPPQAPPLSVPLDPGVMAPALKKTTLWGTVLIVIGAFFTYNTVLFTTLAIVRSNARLKVPTELIFQILFCLALMFICLRAGSRRKQNWPTLFGICLLIFGGLAVMSFSVLARRPNSLAREVMIPTVIILAAAGSVSLVFGFIRRAYNNE